ncbi:N/A [soil metagenome]
MTSRHEQEWSSDTRPPIATTFTTTRPDGPVPEPPLTATELGLTPTRRTAPSTGWRKTLHRMTGAPVVSQPVAGEPGSRGLAEHGRHAVGGTRSIAVLSLKGGVGKTTTTVGLGATFALTRGDRVIAVDANPDFGTLAQRGPNNCDSTVRTLLNDPTIVRYSDVRRHTSQGPNRLEFLGSERDPAVSESFSENDYRAVHATLDRFYNIILTDCGTGLTHSVTKGVLDTADSLVVVGSPSIDSARSVLATIDWLAHHGYSHLIADAVVVLSAAWSDYLPVDLDQLSRHFEQRVSRVVFVPYDAHLAEGGQIRVDLLSHKTQQAYADLASHLTAGSLIQP